jgi:hypothetical protein
MLVQHGTTGNAVALPVALSAGTGAVASPRPLLGGLLPLALLVPALQLVPLLPLLLLLLLLVQACLDPSTCTHATARQGGVCYTRKLRWSCTHVLKLLSVRHTYNDRMYRQQVHTRNDQ